MRTEMLEKPSFAMVVNFVYHIAETGKDVRQDPIRISVRLLVTTTDATVRLVGFRNAD